MSTVQQGMEVKNRKITVIGAARSGLGVCELVLRLGGVAKLSEFKSLDAIDKDIRGADFSRIKTEFGGHTQAFIEDSDYLVLSPGVRKDIAPVRWAEAKGIPVLGEIELAYRFCPAPIVAVTGSNGKTTVVTLISQIIRESGRGVCLCGNIGNPFSKQVLDLKPTDTVVLEISSFQLETTSQFKPRVGVFLNFSQNHLDRHKDLQEYFEAKAMMFAHQDAGDFAVLNYDCDKHQKLARNLKANVSFFNAPEKREAVANPNFLAALDVARILGIDDEISFKVFEEFKGVEHRLEFVRSLDGVEYINDSKSTTAEASRWALERMTKSALWICGGRDKNIDFSVLRDLAKSKVRKICAIGEAAGKIKATYGDEIPVEIFPSLQEAVASARAEARAGECVLLSPMCASFDMFDNYEHRGKVYKSIIQQLT